MKKLRRLTALLLALVMVMSLGVSVLADEDWQTPTEYSITITNTADEIEHIYKAYQIFKGDVVFDANADDDPVEYYLSNIEWGASVDTTKEVDGKTLLEALYNLTVDDTTPFKAAFDAIYKEQKSADPTDFSDFNTNNVTITADDVASVLSEADDDDVLARKFADIVAKYLKATSDEVEYTENEETKKITYPAASTKAASEQKYTIDVKLPGYYLVKDETKDYLFGEGAYSDYILEVAGPVTATAKSEVPSVDKKIVVGDDEVDHNVAAIGDTIKYVLYGYAPSETELGRYEEYVMKFVDTLSKGLTYDGSEKIKVTLQYTKVDSPANSDWTDFGYTLTDGDYTVTPTAAKTPDGNETTVTVTIKDLIDLIEKALDADNVESTDIKAVRVKVELSATLNNYAEIAPVGNDNKVKLEYSNDPTWDPDDPDNSGKEPPMGETPEEKVTTYTTGIEIFKYTGDKKPLTGAEFKITGTAFNKVVKTVSAFAAWKANGEFTQDGALSKNVEGYKPATAPTVYYKLKSETEAYTTSVPKSLQDAKDNYADCDSITDLNNVPKYMKESSGYVTYNAESTTAEGYVAATAPTKYYKLKNGKYTTTAPTDGTKDDYDFEGVEEIGSVKEYMRVTYTVAATEEELKDSSFTATVDDNGYLYIDGLNEGIYLIEETQQPSGYNKLKYKIAVEIKAVWNEESNSYTWYYRTAKVSTSATSVPAGTFDEKAPGEEGASPEWKAISAGADGKIRALEEVENKKGLTLPGTGGMGTYAFYGVGGMLIVLALVMLIMKKRTSKEK